MIPAALSSRRWRWLLNAILPLVILGGSYFLLQAQLRALDIDAVRHALRIIPASKLCLALVATAGSYISLGVLEWTLFKTAAVPVRYRSVLLCSFISNSVSNGVGMAMFSGAFLRLRIYSGWSLPARDTLFVTLALAPVVVVAGGLAGGAALLLGLQAAQTAYLASRFGVVCLALALMVPAAVFLMAAPGKHLSIKKLGFVVPARRDRLVLIAAGLCDWLFASCALFVLTGTSASAYPLLLVQFIPGWLIGAASGVPAGAGALDTTVLGTLADNGNLAGMVAGLLMFRVIYIALPVVLALALLLTSELRRNAAP